MIHFESTRNSHININFERVILEGQPVDGGLFFPKTIPQLSSDFQSDAPYYKIVAGVLYKYTGLNLEFLEDICQDAYLNFAPDPIPLKKLTDDTFVLELFHGPTLSFKDYALQVLAKLMNFYLQKQNKKILILTATSGDTGSAAIEAFKDCTNIKIAVLHPKNAVSEIQRKQMTTVDSENVLNIALEGDFDSCQALVKYVLTNQPLATHISTVNSINFGRILIQMAYYIATCLKFNTNLDFIVPTGNFGNVLSAYLAKLSGFNIGNLVVALNANNALENFYKTGTFIKHKTIPTLACAMDISNPSNFERFMYLANQNNADEIRDIFTSLSGENSYHKPQIQQHFKQDFQVFHCTDENIKIEMIDFFAKYKYAIDPHTATAIYALKQTKGKNTKIIVSTASPVKFIETVKDTLSITPQIPIKIQEILQKPEKFISLPNSKESLIEVLRDF